MFKKKPTTSSALSEFMRNGSEEEHQRVFMKVIEDSIRDQQAIIEQAERLKAEAECRHYSKRLIGRGQFKRSKSA